MCYLQYVNSDSFIYLLNYNSLHAYDNGSLNITTTFYCLAFYHAVLKTISNIKPVLVFENVYDFEYLSSKGLEYFKRDTGWFKTNIEIITLHHHWDIKLYFTKQFMLEIVARIWFVFKKYFILLINVYQNNLPCKLITGKMLNN